LTNTWRRHCDPRQPLQYAGLAAQKNYMALYLMTVYGDIDTEQWFRKAYQASGKKLDMGKSCVRFRKLEDLPLDVIAQVIARVPVQAYIARIENLHPPGKSTRERRLHASAAGEGLKSQ
jgi:Domain of unknown function (DU1801)